MLGFIRDISALYWAQYSHTISFNNYHFYLVIMCIQRVYYVHFEFKIQNVQLCMYVWESILKGLVRLDEQFGLQELQTKLNSNC